eukprot:TRINITY_DN20216_c0_g1_i5.p1 TRINITY_DN20216_c0_g1~~TRINITY_DN20216_c0_g1_i5.p1  ORF type:complete len:709 (+),score=117.80 TRINITY_DN20216_c0_g1_i5:121-2247(+)
MSMRMRPPQSSVAGVRRSTGSLPGSIGMPAPTTAPAARGGGARGPPAPMSKAASSSSAPRLSPRGPAGGDSRPTLRTAAKAKAASAEFQTPVKARDRRATSPTTCNAMVERNVSERDLAQSFDERVCSVAKRAAAIEQGAARRALAAHKEKALQVCHRTAELEELARRQPVQKFVGKQLTRTANFAPMATLQRRHYSTPQSLEVCDTGLSANKDNSMKSLAKTDPAHIVRKSSPFRQSSPGSLVRAPETSLLPQQRSPGVTDHFDNAPASRRLEESSGRKLSAQARNVESDGLVVQELAEDQPVPRPEIWPAKGLNSVLARAKDLHSAAPWISHNPEEVEEDQEAMSPMSPQTNRKNVSGGTIATNLTSDSEENCLRKAIATPRRGRDNVTAKASLARSTDWVARGGGPTALQPEEAPIRSSGSNAAVLWTPRRSSVEREAALAKSALHSKPFAVDAPPVRRDAHSALATPVVGATATVTSAFGTPLRGRQRAMSADQRRRQLGKTPSVSSITDVNGTRLRGRRGSSSEGRERRIRSVGDRIAPFADETNSKTTPVDAASGSARRDASCDSSASGREVCMSGQGVSAPSRIRRPSGGREGPGGASPRARCSGIASRKGRLQGQASFCSDMQSLKEMQSERIRTVRGLLEQKRAEIENQRITPALEYAEPDGCISFDYLSHKIMQPDGLESKAEAHSEPGSTSTTCPAG